MSNQFLHTDLFDMAVAYLFHLCRNHPFVDGNKRTATAAALVFLALNDVEVQADPDALADLVLGVAQGKVDKQDIASFMRAHCR